MKYLYILFALLFLSSCGTKKNATSESEDGTKLESHKVSMLIQYRKPYCGGARPSPEMEKGTLHPMANKEFFIKASASNHDSIPVFEYFKTDKDGRAEVYLPDNFYSIFQKRKDYTFEEFKKAELKRYEGKDLEYTGDDSCLKLFWSSPDGFFSNIGESVSHEFEVRSTCYSDFNFCMKFTGPYPP